jgi:RimJ/RimL family protein N-acetyltransferase
MEGWRGKGEMIRELRWNDFNDLVDDYYSYFEDLEEDSELGLVAPFKRPGIDEEAEWFSSLYSQILNGNAVASVAEVDGKVVGMCDVHRIRPGTELQHTGLLGIAIRKEFRGKGIGEQLMRETLGRCRGKFEIIILDVFVTNKRAISLYRKIGFREFGILPRSVKRGDRYFDEMKMYYPLD